jgi:hypothetical protein
MRKILPLLALLPLPAAAAGDLGWHVQVVTTSKYAPVEFQAQLLNVTKGNIKVKAEGDKPLIDLILEPEGKPPVRKPLPKETSAFKGPPELQPSQALWYVTGDLRLAFGRLAPGRYTLRAAIGDRVSEPAPFEIVDTSAEEAKKNSVAPEGVDLRVKDGKALLVNRRKTPIFLLAYGDREPLDALAMAQQWTGRAWTGPQGLFCGTGLSEVKIVPGEEREVTLPPLPDGILRIGVSCYERKGDGTEAIEAVSEPFLVDTFKG